MIAFENGDFDTAVEKLWPLRDRWSPIGGSHAQRDVFTQILIDAAIGAKQLTRARTLLSQRLTIRPHSVTSWNKYAAVMRALGRHGRRVVRGGPCPRPALTAAGRQEKPS